MNNVLAQAHEEPEDALTTLLSNLPPIPATVRYFDDFDDKTRTIKDYSSFESCDIFLNGTKVTLNFSRFGNDYGNLMRHLFFFLINQDLRISTIYNYIIGFIHVDRPTLNTYLSAGPFNIKKLWELGLANSNFTVQTFQGLKSLLMLLASNYLNGWSPMYIDFLRQSLPNPSRDRYTSIRNGDAFLSLDEEEKIVRYLDEMAQLAIKGTVNNDDLIACGMLLCSYQFGMRPIQIAMVEIADVRCWDNSPAESSAVHITFTMVKQRSTSAVLPLNRKIKNEWTPIIRRIFQDANPKENKRLFQATSADEVARAIRNLSSDLVGASVTANDLRHTAAQRLVDAGCSQEELAQFLGHSSLNTGLVYFQTSANQAERVNKRVGRDSYEKPKKQA